MEMQNSIATFEECFEISYRTKQYYHVIQLLSFSKWVKTLYLHKNQNMDCYRSLICSRQNLEEAKMSFSC